MLRYKVDSTDTGFEGKEGTFTICSWWLVSALAMIGEIDRARGLVQEAAVLCRSSRSLRRGDRRRQRGAPRELPPGLHPPGADRRRVRVDRGRRRTDLNSVDRLGGQVRSVPPAHLRVDRERVNVKRPTAPEGVRRERHSPAGGASRRRTGLPTCARGGESAGASRLAPSFFWPRTSAVHFAVGPNAQPLQPSG